MKIQEEIQIKSFSPLETQILASKLAKKILSLRTHDKAIIISLQGEIGSGKTTFLKGLAKGFSIKEEILSSSFVIFQTYKIPKKSKTLVHLDLYRLKSEKELNFINFEKLLKNKDNIIVIEWGKNIKRILPKERIDVKFKVLGPRERKIKIQSFYAF